MILDIQGITCGFLERNGGVSSHPYDSLNVKSSPLVNDSVANVAKNLSTVLNKSDIDLGSLIMLYLEGGSEVIEIDEAGGHRTIYGVDGAVTKLKNCTLAISVADCLPVLLFDKKAGVIGISHAGWKGSAEGITSKVLAKMVDLGAKPEDIVATIGPAICGNCYEVDNEVAERFASDFVTRKENGKYTLSLHGANKAELENAGVTMVNVVEMCTYENTDKFFSARKDDPTGRFLAYIMSSKG